MSDDTQYIERIAHALERISYACYDESGDAPLQRIAQAIGDGDEETPSSLRRIANALTCSRICEEIDRLGDMLGNVRAVLEALDRTVGKKGTR